MSTVTPFCGCVIDNGNDGETFTMLEPCERHTTTAQAIADAIAAGPIIVGNAPLPPGEV